MTNATKKLSDVEYADDRFFRTLDPAAIAGELAERLKTAAKPLSGQIAEVEVTTRGFNDQIRLELLKPDYGQFVQRVSREVADKLNELGAYALVKVIPVPSGIRGLISVKIAISVT